MVRAIIERKPDRTNSWSGPRFWATVIPYCLRWVGNHLDRRSPRGWMSYFTQENMQKFWFSSSRFSVMNALQAHSGTGALFQSRPRDKPETCSLLPWEIWRYQRTSKSHSFAFHYYGEFFGQAKWLKDCTVVHYWNSNWPQRSTGSQHFTTSIRKGGLFCLLNTIAQYMWYDEA